MTEKLTLNDWYKLQVIKDGDSYVVVPPDFENLQVSNSYWFSPGDDSYWILEKHYEKSKYPLQYLQVYKVGQILEELNKDMSLSTKNAQLNWWIDELIKQGNKGNMPYDDWKREWRQIVDRIQRER